MKKDINQIKECVIFKYDRAYKKRNINKILHEPLDRGHYNYDSYKMTSDYLVRNL